MKRRGRTIAEKELCVYIKSKLIRLYMKMMYKLGKDCTVYNGMDAFGRVITNNSSNDDRVNTQEGRGVVDGR